MRKIRMRVVLPLLALALAAGAEEGKEERKEKELPKAPAFKLKDFNGNEHALADFKDKWVVLEWINHGCPYVKKHYDAGNMQRLQKKYRDKGVVWLSVCSSAEGKQGYYEPEAWKKVNEEKKGAADAVLLDADGKVGKAYGAKVTPQMFVVSPKGEIVYQGAIDDKANAWKPEDIKAAANYIEQVLDAVLASKEPPVRATQAYG